MRFIVQVRIEPDDTSDPTVVNVATIERGELSSATLGLSIEDAKAVLAGVQETVVTEHCASALTAASTCEGCGRRLAHKDDQQLIVRTLYGKMTVSSPRWWSCPCQGGRRRPFTPLAVLLPERSTPELGLVEAKLAAHTSYQAAGRLLGELLPVGRRVHGNETRRRVHHIGERLDRELDDGDRDPYSFLTATPRVLRALPRPDMPLIVTIDGGYIHSSRQTSRRDGWFQAVCGTVTRHDGHVRRFGFVPSVDTHPRRRIHDTLHAQGMQPNQQVTFLADGADDLAGWTDLQNENATYVLDWFHIAMRFTVLTNTMTGLQDDPTDDDLAGVADILRDDVERAKWHVWHGNIHRALQLLGDTSCGLLGCDANDSRVKTAKMLDELIVYVDRNQATIPNYAERRLAGEPISSATAEATVNLVIAARMVKKQQMRWSPLGAHRMLQVRTHVLDDQLDHDIHRWHPRTTDPNVALAA